MSKQMPPPGSSRVARYVQRILGDLLDNYNSTVIINALIAEVESVGIREGTPLVRELASCLNSAAKFDDNLPIEEDEDSDEYEDDEEDESDSEE